jgi:hypothetical protein
LFGTSIHPPHSQVFQVTPSASSAGTHWQSTQFETCLVCLQELPVFSQAPQSVLGHSWLFLQAQGGLFRLKTSSKSSIDVSPSLIAVESPGAKGVAQRRRRSLGATVN